jgi:MarR family transcriptional regulator, organic hydroperoxide resistance regulator
MYLCFEARMTAPDQRLIWLLSRAQRRVMAQSDAALAGLGLTSTQAGALFCIRGEDGITVGELADQLDLAQSAASGLAQRLETAGLVARSPNPEDGRSVRLVLTKSGRRRREDAIKIAHAGNAALGAGFSNSEIAIVARWLARIGTATETDNDRPHQDDNAGRRARNHIRTT